MDGRAYGRTYRRTFQTPSNVIRSTRRSRPKRRHRHRIWTVQSYSSGCANVHPPSDTSFLGANPRPQPKRHLYRFSHSCTAHCRLFLYFTKGRPFPLKITPSQGIWTPSNTWFLGPPVSIIQTASRSVQPLLQGSRSCQIERPTDRPRYSVCKNRLHLWYVVIYCDAA